LLTSRGLDISDGKSTPLRKGQFLPTAIWDTLGEEGFNRSIDRAELRDDVIIRNVGVYELRTDRALRDADL
jgi:hypothetical protein